MPYSLSKIALAGLLSSAAHTLGHVEQGNMLGVKVKVNPSTLTETWDRKNPKKDLKMQGAGFRTQDDLLEKLGDSPITKEIGLVNAAYKLGYLLGLPQKLGAETKGDIDNIGKLTGSKAPTQLSLIASILSDIHKSKNPDRKWDLGFWQSKKGAPGLRLTIKQ